MGTSLGHIEHVHIYLLVHHKYWHTHEDGGVLEYPYQDSIPDIISRKYKKIFIEKFPSQIFPLCLYTLSIELRI